MVSSIDLVQPASSSSSTTTPVIFIHGLLGQKRNFGTLVKLLDEKLETKRHIISIDMRNHGANDHDWRVGMSYVEMSNDVITYLNHRNFERVILVGHSVGGKIAQAVALRHPDRVAG